MTSAMRRSSPNDFPMPELSLHQAQVLLMHASDFLMRLSADLRVLKVTCSGDFDRSLVAEWEGRAFDDIVAPDSAMKITRLFSDNSAVQGAEGRWRHLNLKIGAEPNLPVLLKYFRFSEEDAVVNMICARDLRSVLGMQQRFHREVDAMERRMSKLQALLKTEQ